MKFFPEECSLRNGLAGPRFIVNFPTKRHWRGKSRIEGIESGLAALRHEIGERDIRSIAIPALGSGLGGLNWPEVKSRIVAALANINVPVCVYEPGKTQAAGTMVRTARPPMMTTGRATLVTR